MGVARELGGNRLSLTSLGSKNILEKIYPSVHISQPSAQCFPNRIMSRFKPNSVPMTLQPIHLRTCQLNSLFSPPKFLLAIILLPLPKKKKSAAAEVTIPGWGAARVFCRGGNSPTFPHPESKTKASEQRLLGGAYTALMLLTLLLDQRQGSVARLPTQACFALARSLCLKH